MKTRLIMVMIPFLLQSATVNACAVYRQQQGRNDHLCDCIDHGFSLDHVKQLIERGAQVNGKRTWSGGTPLHCVARQSNDDAIWRYLLERGADVNAKNHIDSTPCHEAAIGNKDDLIIELFKRGADVNAKNIGSETPLHYACRNGHLDSVKALFECGADLAKKNYMGKTAAVVAQEYGYLEIAEYINDRLDIPDTKGVMLEDLT